MCMDREIWIGCTFVVISVMQVVRNHGSVRDVCKCSVKDGRLVEYTYSLIRGRTQRTYIL